MAGRVSIQRVGLLGVGIIFPCSLDLQGRELDGSFRVRDMGHDRVVKAECHGTRLAAHDFDASLTNDHTYPVTEQQSYTKFRTFPKYIELSASYSSQQYGRHPTQRSPPVSKGFCESPYHSQLPLARTWKRIWHIPCQYTQPHQKRIVTVCTQSSCAAPSRNPSDLTGGGL